MRIIKHLTAIALASAVLACDSKGEAPQPPKPAFVQGADISWVTQMESEGIVFRHADGRAADCFDIMKQLGMQAIRLRVWVDPADGWCSAADVLAKAERAKRCGMDVMVDFHLSDTWADPAHQTKPAAWADMDSDGLTAAIRQHVTDVLTMLVSHGISPRWVQIGNETSDGMLWPDGKASLSMSGYAQLHNAGYYAAKAVCPQAQVIVHIANAQKLPEATWLLDGLRSNGAVWDVIGLSLYPDADAWQPTADAAVQNLIDLSARYGTHTMLCETGMPASRPDDAYNYLSYIQARLRRTRTCDGIFYWEPQAYAMWQGYGLGAFTDDGKPSRAMEAFGE